MEWHEEPGWHEHAATAGHDVLSRIAHEVLADAKVLAPVDTGRLRESLKAEVSGDTARVGSNVDYAGYVEEGHRVAYRGADGAVHYTGAVVPPQPYLRPALFRERGA